VSAPDADVDAAPVEASFELPPGVLAVRVGPGANCSSAGSAIDVLFYGSVVVGAIAVALAAAFPPREPDDDAPSGKGGGDADAVPPTGEPAPADHK
jgi:hypothetical protein